MAIDYLLTVADYHDHVEHLPPDAPMPELLNGRFVMSAHPVRLHMRYAQGIFRAIDAYMRSHHYVGEILTEFEVVLDNHTILIPDVAYLITGNQSARMTEERLYGAPDMVCEIASPSTRMLDASEKYLAYLRAGVQEYWIVDPYLPAGDRFKLYERRADPQTQLPAFHLIAGGPSASRIFPNIAVEAELL